MPFSRRYACTCIPLLFLWLPDDSVAKTYELKSGDKISGEVIRLSETHVVLEHAVLGRLELPLSEVAPPEPPAPGLFGTSFLEGWERTAQLGVNGERGNSESTDVTAGLDLKYDDDALIWNVDGRFAFSSADGSTTANNALFEAERWRRFDGSRFFWFGTGRFDWDEFRSWDYRLNATTGLGYEFVKTDGFTLRGGAGPSATREFGGTDLWRWEVFVGLKAEWEVAKDHTIALGNRFFQAVNEDQPYRNLTSATWKWKLSEDPGLSLNLKVENEYDSAPLSGKKRNDLKYTTSIGVDF